MPYIIPTKKKKTPKKETQSSKKHNKKVILFIYYQVCPRNTSCGETAESLDSFEESEKNDSTGRVWNGDFRGEVIGKFCWSWVVSCVKRGWSVESEVRRDVCHTKKMGRDF